MKLLSIVEIGGYPDFSSLYTGLGLEAQSTNSMRKALKILKKEAPDIVVAEFNFQTDFRDRTSNLESLMAVLQTLPQTHLLVFYEKVHEEVFERFRSRFNNIHALSFPIQPDQLQSLLGTIDV